MERERQYPTNPDLMMSDAASAIEDAKAILTTAREVSLGHFGTTGMGYLLRTDPRVKELNLYKGIDSLLKPIEDFSSEEVEKATAVVKAFLNTRLADTIIAERERQIQPEADKVDGIGNRMVGAFSTLTSIENHVADIYYHVQRGEKDEMDEEVDELLVVAGSLGLALTGDENIPYKLSTLRSHVRYLKNMFKTTPSGFSDVGYILKALSGIEKMRQTDSFPLAFDVDKVLAIIRGVDCDTVRVRHRPGSQQRTSAKTLVDIYNEDNRKCTIEVPAGIILGKIDTEIVRAVSKYGGWPKRIMYTENGTLEFYYENDYIEVDVGPHI